MAVTSSQKQHTPKIVASLASIVPGVKFKLAEAFYWSPEQLTIYYNPETIKKPEGLWSLVHEAAHAKLEHTTYNSDFQLLSMEVDAWQEAKLLAETVGIAIDDDHIQDCLDTYRDWLHKRSTCPTCGTVGLQHSSSEYGCHNCSQPWSVTPARFCRAYRKKSKSAGSVRPNKQVFK